MEQKRVPTPPFLPKDLHHTSAYPTKESWSMLYLVPAAVPPATTTKKTSCITFLGPRLEKAGVVASCSLGPIDRPLIGRFIWGCRDACFPYSRLWVQSFSFPSSFRENWPNYYVRSPDIRKSWIRHCGPSSLKLFLDPPLKKTGVYISLPNSTYRSSTPSPAPSSLKLFLGPPLKKHGLVSGSWSPSCPTSPFHIHGTRYTRCVHAVNCVRSTDTLISING